MILYGKELDDELVKRNKAKEERISQRITMRDYAKGKGISVIELSAYERGEDVCPHLEYRDMADFDLRFIFKICKKCGMVVKDSIEKVGESNLDRVYSICKEAKENKNLHKK